MVVTTHNFGIKTHNLGIKTLCLGIKTLKIRIKTHKIRIKSRNKPNGESSVRLVIRKFGATQVRILEASAGATGNPPPGL